MIDRRSSIFSLRTAALAVLSLALVAVPVFGHRSAAHADSCGSIFDSHPCTRPNPTSLAATPQDATTVQLTWNEPFALTLATVYVSIRRNGVDQPNYTHTFVQDGGFLGVPAPGVQRVGVSVPNLDPNTSYCFAVQTKSTENLVSDNLSNWSCARTPLPPFSAPSTPNLLSSTATTATISFFPGVGGDHILVGCSDISSGDPCTPYSIAPNATHATLTGLRLGDTYAVFVCQAESGPNARNAQCSDDLMVTTHLNLSPATVQASSQSSLLCAVRQANGEDC